MPHVTQRSAARSAGLVIALAVLVGAVSPFVCLCANAARPADPPACHAAIAPPTSHASVSVPCCCEGDGKRSTSLATKPGDEREPKLLPAGSTLPSQTLALAAASSAPKPLGPPPTHSPPGSLTPLRI